MRKSEYPMLKGLTYLDHGGTTLAPKSLLKSFSKEMQATLLANPHSDSSNPSASAVIVEETRHKVLRLFNADPAHFDVVFTANATAAIKLVMEGFSGIEGGFNYRYHRNSHTSLVGVRELANQAHCIASDEEMANWLLGHNVETERQSGLPTLFAYPAQSNMNGERLPLDWAGKLRFSLHHPNTYTLLDAAALVSTTPLDLSNHLFAPDFIALSFYKIFGFPDLGALILRKDAGHILDHRKYFGGGTTEMITCIGDSWAARKQSSFHVRLEDGTIAIRSILALRCAIDTHRKLFGQLGEVSKHTAWLAKELYERLANLRHSNGAPVCQIYKAAKSTYGDTTTQGATVAFNIRRSDGTWLGCWHVGADLRKCNIHVRTGNLCNPAGMACALGVDAEWLRSAFDEEFRCNTEIDVLRGVPIGMVRVTFGAMNTLEDVNTLVSFIDRNLVEHKARTTLRQRPSVTSRIEKESSLSMEPEDTSNMITLPNVQNAHSESDKRSTARTFHRPPSLWSMLRRMTGSCMVK
ncbi:pyridoxal phosphate-dependent transferase [Pyrenochaeta sp. MPI-SDFR-AT-0127]|nr:pyridoxal phosphate-dependent transferase [Pyrenochaeta sp. MPI-SDFR-AT-0127]